MDEVIFEEFKGTGNMQLDRRTEPPHLPCHRHFTPAHAEDLLMDKLTCSAFDPPQAPADMNSVEAMNFSDRVEGSRNNEDLAS